MGLGGTSRDDANNFFVVFFIIRVHNQEYRAGSDGPDRFPAFLFIKSGVSLRQSVRIVKHENCGFKPNIVLAQVFPVLVLVPFETH